MNDQYKPLVTIASVVICLFLCSTLLSRSSNDSYLIKQMNNDNKELTKILISTQKNLQKAKNNVILLTGRISELALSSAMNLDKQAMFLKSTVCEIEAILIAYDVLEPK